MSPSPRSRVRRGPERGAYDPQTIHAIVDEALLCHVGIVTDGHPLVIPMLHARIDSTLYLHGSQGSRLMRALKAGAEACVTVTLLDGLVLARSALHHSMNYRSVVLFGRGRDVTDRDEKWRAMRALVEQVVPGRWSETRQPSDAEDRATAVVALPIDEASAKVRRGPPVDDEADLEGPWWAGVVPLVTVAGAPEPAPELAEAPIPEHIAAYVRHRQPSAEG